MRKHSLQQSVRESERRVGCFGGQCSTAVFVSIALKSNIVVGNNCCYYTFKCFSFYNYTVIVAVLFC